MGGSEAVCVLDRWVWVGECVWVVGVLVAGACASIYRLDLDEDGCLGVVGVCLCLCVFRPGGGTCWVGAGVGVGKWCGRLGQQHAMAQATRRN